MIRKILIPSLFIAAAVFLFFFLTDKTPLWSSDEGRYGEIAREMWETKNFIVPHFNYLPHLEKPAFAPFLVSLSYSLFGVNDLSTRLVTILAALGTLLASFCFVRKLFDGRTAAFTALVLMTTIGFVLVGRFAVIDMIMTFFLTMAIFCLAAAFFLQEKKYYLISYAFMGLAFLTKGLIGILLPGLIYFIFLAITKNLGEIKRMSLGWGFLIVGVITVPWTLLISMREPEFFQYFIVKSHFGRFASGTFGRHRPFWFFIPIFIAIAFPWSLFMPAAIVSEWKRSPLQRIKIQFLLVWIATIFIFFSIPKSKLPYYLLPLSAPFAALLGSFFSQWGTDKKKSPLLAGLIRGAWIGIAAVCILGAIGSNVYLLFWAKKMELLALRPLFYVATTTLAVGSFMGLLLYQKGRQIQSVSLLAGTVFVLLIFTAVGIKTITPYHSTSAFAEALQNELKPEDKVAIFSSPDHFSDFPFYLKRRVIIAGSDRGTLTMSSNRPDKADDVKNYFMSIEDLVQSLNDPGHRIFCLLDAKRITRLQELGLKNYKVIKEGYKKLLISNEV